MNSGQLNSYNLNGPASGGHNAILSAGFGSSASLAALLVVGAMLTGGMSTAAEAGGRVSAMLTGGVNTTSSLGGIQFKTANMQGGIYSLSNISSNLGIAPGLNGGVVSPSGYGGQLLTNMRLQMADTVGDSSLAGGSLCLDAVVTGGLVSNSWLTSQIVGSTVLFADGVYSTSQLEGDLNTGRQLSSGVSSTAELTGKYHITGLLQGGIASNSILAQGLAISPRLQEGVISIGVTDSPAMRINAMLNSGISNDAVFVAQIIISPKSNFGVDSNSMLSAGMRKSAVLSDGLYVYSLAGSEALRATQRLSGGFVSTGYAQASLLSSPHLNDGAASSAYLTSNLISQAILSSGMNSTGLFACGVRITARLQNGSSTDCMVGGSFKSASKLIGGMNQDCWLGGSLLGNVMLSGGIASDEVIGSDIVQEFTDPLLNTWALDIRSATQILSIETPTQDV